MADLDSADLNGGNLTVSIAGATANEDLGILNQGTGANQIGASGTTVSYGGVAIGTITGNGRNGSNLVVEFNSAGATQGAATALVRFLTYANDNQNPSGSRTLSAAINDGDGTTSVASAVTVNLTAVNDSPAIGGVPTDITVTEDTSGNFNLFRRDTGDRSSNGLK